MDTDEHWNGLAELAGNDAIGTDKLGHRMPDYARSGQPMTRISVRMICDRANLRILAIGSLMTIRHLVFLSDRFRDTRITSGWGDGGACA